MYFVLPWQQISTKNSNELRSINLQPTMYYYIIGSCVDIMNEEHKYHLTSIPSHHFTLN